MVAWSAVQLEAVTYACQRYERMLPDGGARARSHCRALPLIHFRVLLPDARGEPAPLCLSRQRGRTPGVTRAGFFVGDGAGMGKGREIAGLLAENILQVIMPARHPRRVDCTSSAWPSSRRGARRRCGCPSPPTSRCRPALLCLIVVLSYYMEGCVEGRAKG